MRVNINIMCANIKVFNLLAGCHYKMNLSCTPIYKPNHEKNSAVVGTQQRCRPACPFFMTIYAWLKHKCLPLHILGLG